MRRITFLALLCGALCLLYTPVQAQLLLYESFDADVSGGNVALNGQTTGSGFAAGWNVQNSDPGYAITDATPLTYGQLVSDATHAIGGGSYVSCGRGIDVATDGVFADYLAGSNVGKPGTTLWLSALVRAERTNSYKFGLKTNGTNWGGTELVLIKDLSGKWGLSGARLASDVASTVDVVLDETVLVVLKMEFGASSADLSLFINPTDLGGPEPASPTITATTSSALEFSGLRFYPGSGNDNGSLDEIRMGATYADVTPVPSPTLDKLTTPDPIWDIDGQQTYMLAGITDGVATDESITVTAVSTDKSVVADPTVVYTSPNTTGELKYTPLTDGTTTIQVTVKASNVPGVKYDEFVVEVLNSKINHAPTIDPLDNILVEASAGQQTITLTGIGDGDAFYSQNISITAISKNMLVVPSPIIEYVQGENTATLKYTPTGTAGNAEIEITLVDDENGTSDGGENTKIISFTINTIDSYDAFGWSDYFDNGNTDGWWANEYSLAEEDDVLKVTGHKKSKWVPFGSDFGRSIDISEVPYMNLKIKTGNLEKPFTITCYMKDVNNKNYTVQKRVGPSENYTKLFIDFTDADSKLDMTQITGVFYAINGYNLTWSGEAWLDEVHVGYYAAKFANIAAPANKSYYMNSGSKQIRLTDIEYTESLSISGGESLIENVSFSNDIASGYSIMSFDLKADATGSEQIDITANGTAGYGDNTVSFTLAVEDNMAPTLDPLADLNLQTGDERIISLTGISDGDATASQDLSITVISDNPTATGDFTFNYQQGFTKTDLSFTPTQAADNVTITVTIDDGQSSNNTVEQSFTVNIYDELNNPPLIDNVPNQDAILAYGKQTITLQGLADGDDGTQSLSLTVSSSEQSVVPDANLEISYTNGQPQAFLSYTPAATGKTTISLTVTDNGGTVDNNGNASTSIDFDLEVLEEAQTGYVYQMSDPADMAGSFWEPSGSYTNLSYVTFDSYNNVMKVDFANKSNWDGIWSNIPVELNVKDNPYISCDIYPVDKESYFHIYFYDFAGNRNADGAHAERVHAPANQWTHCEFDFTPEGYLQDKDGNPIRTDRITDLLINMHPDNYPFPFTKHSGTVYIRNLRIGDQAVFGAQETTCTIDNVMPKSHFFDADAEPVTIDLSGISNGEGSTNGVSVTVSSSLETTANPSVGIINPDGTASLTYTPGNYGISTIDLTVSAPDASDYTTSFTIAVMSDESSNAHELTINLDETHQMFRGIGSMLPPAKYAEMYGKDLSATACRIGINGNAYSNPFEPVNDNDDPNVIDMSKFNRNITDWNNVRYLMANGVETFIMTVWSPEAWMKDNYSVDMSAGGVDTDNDNTTNKLSYHYYEEYAEYLTAYCIMFEEETGQELTAIGLQNEPAFHEPYGSAILDPEHFAILVGVVGDRFQKEGISTGFMVSEQVVTQGANSMDDYVDAIQANAKANAYCDFIATHGYAEDGIGDANPDFSTWSNLYDNAQEGANPKELWMTETSAGADTWKQGLGKAGAIYGLLGPGNGSLWTSFNADGQLFDKFGVPTPSYKTYKHYTKFIRPGATRVTATSPTDDIFVLSFDNEEEDGGNLSTVLINHGDLPLTVSLNISGASVPTGYDVYTTEEMSDKMTLKQQGIAAGDVIILPAMSITTVNGYGAENTHTLTVTDGEGGGSYAANAQVTVTANEPAEHYKFYQWTGDVDYLEDKYSATTVLTMPNEDAGIAAQYVELPQYTLTVVGGTGGGQFYPEESTTITAGDSTGKYLEFVEWTGDVLYVDDATSATAEVTMPDKSITLTATYQPMKAQVTILLVDEADDPISGVKFFIDGVRWTSGDNGDKLLSLEYGEHDYSLEIEGYMSDNGQFTVTEDPQEVKITLIEAGINEQLAQQVSLYPNPANNQLMIDLPAGRFNSLEVLDLTGKTLISQKIANGQSRKQLDVSQLFSGMYFIRLQGQSTYQAKFMIH